MFLKKILTIIIIICLVASLSGCGTLDVMKGLKNEPEMVTDLNDLSDFSMIDDGVGEVNQEPVVEASTGIEPDVKTKEIIAYYENANGFVVPVKTKIPWEEGIAKATVKSLVVGSDIEKKVAQSGLRGVIPENTEILGMSIQDGLCRIDFSQNILNTETYEQEANMISALTYTLTEFDTINRVELMVDGQILPTLSKGYQADIAFERENINLLGDASGVNYMVYFKSPDTEVAGYYVPITFTAEAVDNPASIVLTKLFEGAPEELPLRNEIPYGVNFRGLSMNGDVATVDLGIGALNLTQEDYENMNQIVVLCLEQFGEVTSVDFRIEGMSFEEAGLNFQDSNITPVFNEIN